MTKSHILIFKLCPVYLRNLTKKKQYNCFRDAFRFGSQFGSTRLFVLVIKYAELNYFGLEPRIRGFLLDLNSWKRLFPWNTGHSLNRRVHTRVPFVYFGSVKYVWVTYKGRSRNNSMGLNKEIFVLTLYYKLFRICYVCVIIIKYTFNSHSTKV